MLLNLIILKIFPPFPGRGCKKKGLPWLTTDNRSIRTNNNGDRSTSKTNAIRKSMTGLIKALYIYEVKQGFRDYILFSKNKKHYGSLKLGQQWQNALINGLRK